VYAWDGRIEEDGEVLCLVKTRADLFDALASRVRALHPYQIPEVLGFAVAAGSPEYLAWLADATAPTTP
jgi:periplasmic divalent cation tolerance protein